MYRSDRSDMCRMATAKTAFQQISKEVPKPQFIFFSSQGNSLIMHEKWILHFSQSKWSITFCLWTLHFTSLLINLGLADFKEFGKEINYCNTEAIVLFYNIPSWYINDCLCFLWKSWSESYDSLSTTFLYQPDSLMDLINLHQSHDCIAPTVSVTWLLLT